MSTSGGVCKKVKSWGDDGGLGSVFLIHDAQTEPLCCFFFFFSVLDVKVERWIIDTENRQQQ